MRRSFLLLTVCLLLIILCNGCFVLINTTALSEKNEFKDPGIAGTWLMKEKEIVLHIEDKEDHYILYCAHPLTNVPFTISKIDSADKKISEKFISIKIRYPDAPNIEAYTILGYRVSGDNLYLLNFDSNNEELKKQAKQLPMQNKKLPFVATSAELKKFISGNLDKLIATDPIIRCEFKDQKSLKIFLAFSDYFSIYPTNIFKKSKITDAEIQRMEEQINLWGQKNYQMLPAVFKERTEKHLRCVKECLKTPKASGNRLHRELNDFLPEINDLIEKELLKH